jgi:predicted HicB family RNase H-like nuclease
MSDTQTEAPIMVRVDITRDELRALKMQALEQNKSLRAYLGDVLREKLA